MTDPNPFPYMKVVPVDRALLVKLLLVVAVAALAVAWFITAGWFDAWHNASTFGYAGLTAYVASVLVSTL
jgi:hypothetical protein